MTTFLLSLAGLLNNLASSSPAAAAAPAGYRVAWVGFGSADSETVRARWEADRLAEQMRKVGCSQVRVLSL